MKLTFIFVLVMSIVLLLGCSSSGPEPIYYGEDNCEHCRMTIVDQQFGSEIITKKGKTYKFDSIECLAAYENANAIRKDEFASTWVTDFHSAGTLINIDNAYFVRSKTMRSPMGVGLFAFSSSTNAELFADQNEGIILDHENMKLVVDQLW